MSLVIRKSSISELEAAPNISLLLEEYAAESSIKGLPTPSAKVEMYKNMENTGALCTFAAFLNDILIGYITVLTPVLPHYGKLVAVAESFFVASEHRKTGAGLKLLHEAEGYAKEIGSPGLLISTPLSGNLIGILPHIGYIETSRVFFRGFNNE